MKLLELLAVALTFLAQGNIAQAGRMGPHFGNNPPPSHCIHFRFSSICSHQPHARPEKSDPPPATCEILSSTAPQNRQLKIEFTIDDKMLVEGSNVLIGYDHDESQSSEGREVYSSMPSEVKELPEKIFVVSSEDRPFNHKVMRISFDRFEETLDCSFTF